MSYKPAFAAYAVVVSLFANISYSIAGESPSVTSSTSSSAGQLEEIIVTAQKRESPLQHTPVAITSVSSKELADQVIQQAQDLNNVVPGLQIYPILNSLQVSVRGLGATFLDPRGDPTVATSLDGLYFAKPIANGTALFDIDRIEVLKGPQGTLYGRNAAVGALNIVTNQPVLGQYGGELQVDAGNLGLIGTQGVANLPISDDAAMRISFKTISRDGYIEHYYDDADSKALRVSAIWHATDALDVFAEANYAKIGGHGSTPLSWPCATSVPYSIAIPAACPFTHAGGTVPLTATQESMPGNFQLHLDYDLGWAKLTSISGYVIGSETDSDLPNGDYASQNVVAHSHDVTEEIRLAGTDTANRQGGIQWVAGGYYLTGNASRFYSNLGPPTIYTALPVKSAAGFGQGSIGLTDFLRLTLGARYTSDKKGLESPEVEPLSTQSHNFSYRAGLEADLTSHNLLYATVATGYVAGGINGGNPALPVPPADAQTFFQPETNKAYEVGSKNRFFDQRLQLNADLYYYDFKHYQVFSPAGFNDAPPPQQAISNIGDVTTYGFEFDGAWAVSSNDRLTASVTLAHGTYGAISYPAFAGAPGNFVPSLVTAASGSRLINLPKVESFLGYDHTFNIAGGQVIDAAVNTHYSSNYLLVPGSSDAYDTQKSYHKTNVSLTYKPDEKWSVQLWIENLEDVPVNIYGESPGFRLYSILPPRTFGVTLAMKF